MSFIHIMALECVCRCRINAVPFVQCHFLDAIIDDPQYLQRLMMCLIMYRWYIVTRNAILLDVLRNAKAYLTFYHIIPM